MNILLVIAEERAVRESLRAVVPENDLILFERTVADAVRRLIAIKADALIVDDTASLGRKAVTQLSESAPGIPILALSARNDPETLAGFNLSGSSAVIVKPFSCDDLRNALDRVLGVKEPKVEPSHRESHDAPQAAAISQHRTALRWLSRTASQIRDPQSIGQSLIDSVTDIFDPVRSAFLLEEGGVFRVAASHGIAPTVGASVRLTFATGLMRWFEVNTCLTDRATNPDPEAVKEMHVLGAYMAAPVLYRGRVSGAILVGENAAGREYTLEERELLSTVARCVAISLENAQLYQNLSQQQGRMSTLLDNMTAAVVVIDANKTVSMMNQAAERVLQLRAQDLLGRSVQKLGSGFADVALRTLSDGKPRLRQEVHDAAIDATLGLSAAVIDGEGVAVIFSKLPEQRADAEDIAYSPFWEFLASRVAQEIKNPLVAVNTFAQLLPQKYESEDFRDAFGEVVQKEVGRINRVVETLFEFARHPRLMLQRQSMNDTVTSVVGSFEAELRERSIELETELDPALPETKLDAEFFTQALNNIVQNSVDAMPAGGRLRVQTRKREDVCEVVVSDTGSGVSEQDAPMIFAPFFSTKEQGMGLGLTIASRIAQQHDGELALESNSDDGTSFSIRLPITEVTDAHRSSD
ncbi:MAG: PAS domain-containing protein [bacterium]|nr:PAS domain-containing protein [bacterium]